MERRLAAILAADVVGYSRLMEADEVATLNALRAHRDEVITPAVERHHGRVVKLMGDGTLMEFASVVDAMECAVAIQSAMAERNDGLPVEARFDLRIGINLGDVMVEDDDLYGDGVNVAARLEGLAEPGGICISGPVHDQIRNRLKLAYRDLGEKRVKNMTETVHVYGIDLGLPAPAPAAAPPPLERARASIAVLPFDSLSRDPDDAYLADGLASEIIAMLSRIPDLRVVSRLASFAYRGQAVDPRKLADELDLNYILTGSVRRAGERVLVIAELMDTEDASQLWSGRYHRELTDFLKLQEDLAEAIVYQFGGEYLRAEWRRVSRLPTGNVDAWSLIQKAKSANLPVNRNALDEALRLTRQALELDPGYAGALANLASILMQRVINGSSKRPQEDRAEALAAVERAAELAPGDPSVLRTLGNVWSNCGEHAKAVRALRRAVEIAPFDLHTWGRLARTLAYGGDARDLAESHAILDRNLALAPNHPMRPYWLYFKANACVRTGHYQDAVDHVRRSLDIQPGYAGAWVALANALGFAGQAEAARQAMQKAQQVNPTMTPKHFARQVRIVAHGNEAHIGHSIGGLRAAGLLAEDDGKGRRD